MTHPGPASCMQLCKLERPSTGPQDRAHHFGVPSSTSMSAFSDLHSECSLFPLRSPEPADTQLGPLSLWSSQQRVPSSGKCPVPPSGDAHSGLLPVSLCLLLAVRLVSAVSCQHRSRTAGRDRVSGGRSGAHSAVAWLGFFTSPGSSVVRHSRTLPTLSPAGLQHVLAELWAVLGVCRAACSGCVQGQKGGHSGWGQVFIHVCSLPSPGARTGGCRSIIVILSQKGSKGWEMGSHMTRPVQDPNPWAHLKAIFP